MSPARTLEKNKYEIGDNRTRHSSFGGHIALTTSLHNQRCVREHLDSEGGGKVACKMVIRINPRKYHSMRCKATPQNTTSRKLFVGVLVLLHFNIIPRL